MSIYSNSQEFTAKTITLLVEEVSNVLVNEYVVEGYLLDIMDTKARTVFLQIVHPMYIQGYGTSYKLGIHFTCEDTEECYKNLNVILSMGMDKVYEEEGMATYYKVYELEDKHQFENELKKILSEYYEFDEDHSLSYSFQDTY